MTEEQTNILASCMEDIDDIKERIKEGLDSSREISLALTKLDEANLWLEKLYWDTNKLVD
jgi:hypothetical protein